MKTVALISDIQGNAAALEAALSHIRNENPDHIVCLGDVATGPHPVEVLDLLRAYRCLTVMGNMDRALLHPAESPHVNGNDARWAEIDHWCAAQLSEVGRLYLRSFRSTVALTVGGVSLLGCHGSPRSDVDALDAATPDSELEAMIGEPEARIIATGNMHWPLLRQWRGAWLVNPGSVGLPGGALSAMPTVASYALVRAERGRVEVTFREARYNARQFGQRVTKTGMPHANWYLSLWQTESAR